MTFLEKIIILRRWCISLKIPSPPRISFGREEGRTVRVAEEEGEYGGVKKGTIIRRFLCDSEINGMAPRKCCCSQVWGKWACEKKGLCCFRSSLRNNYKNEPPGLWNENPLRVLLRAKILLLFASHPPQCHLSPRKVVSLLLSLYWNNGNKLFSLQHLLSSISGQFPAPDKGRTWGMDGGRRAAIKIASVTAH